MKKSITQSLVIHFLLIIAVLCTILPFVWMILTSLKTQAESIHIPPIIIPEVWHFENYVKIFEMFPYGSFYFNTVVMATLVTFGQLFFSSMAAYAFARIKFPLNGLIFTIVLSLMMIPGEIYLVPQYLIIKNLGLLNTIAALIIPGLFTVFGTFLLRQFFLSVPKELEEAAIIDGCNHFQIYYRIMLPNIVPGLVAMGIIEVIWSWNSLLWPLIVNSEQDMMTLSAGLAALSGRAGTKYPLVAAGSLLAVLPMLALYAIFQKKFIEGIAATGSKG